MLPPLKEEIGDDIPRYILLEWNHRARWTGNRCLWLFYKAMRKLFVTVWFYYIPFVALALNFVVPYFAALSAEPPSTMDTEYVEWVEKALN